MKWVILEISCNKTNQFKIADLNNNIFIEQLGLTIKIEIKQKIIRNWVKVKTSKTRLRIHFHLKPREAELIYTVNFKGHEIQINNEIQWQNVAQNWLANKWLISWMQKENDDFDWMILLH